MLLLVTRKLCLGKDKNSSETAISYFEQYNFQMPYEGVEDIRGELQNYKTEVLGMCS